MAENIAPTSTELDEMLANYTDQSLAGVTPERLAELSNPEIAALQKMVRQLNQVVGHNPPAEIVSKKIWNNLAAQWQKDGLTAQPKSLWEGLKQQAALIRSTLMAGDRRRLYASVTALAVVIVLIILVPSLSFTNGPLPASAGAGDILIPISILVGLVIVGVIGWWYFRR